MNGVSVVTGCVAAGVPCAVAGGLLGGGSGVSVTELVVADGCSVPVDGAGESVGGGAVITARVGWIELPAD